MSYIYFKMETEQLTKSLTAFSSVFSKVTFDFGTEKIIIGSVCAQHNHNLRVFGFH